MNRELAMEWIQRQLDGDLTWEEQKMLEAHLQTDSELQLFRERLRRVSDGLGSLPAVTPPFSLVDAILPRLDVQANPHGESVRGASDAVSQQAESPLQLPRLERLAGERPEAATVVPPKKRLPVWLAKSAIGATAACLLFGLVSAYGAFGPNGNKEEEAPRASIPAKGESVDPQQPPGVDPRAVGEQENAEPKDQKQQEKQEQQDQKPSQENAEQNKQDKEKEKGGTAVPTPKSNGSKPSGISNEKQNGKSASSKENGNKGKGKGAGNKEKKRDRDDDDDNDKDDDDKDDNDKDDDDRKVEGKAKGKGDDAPPKGPDNNRSDNRNKNKEKKERPEKKEKKENKKD